MNGTTTPPPGDPAPGFRAAIRPVTLTTIALWAAFALWVVFVFWLSSLTAKDLSSLPKTFGGFDKVVHFSLFFAGSIFLTLAIHHTVNWSWRAVILVSVIALSLFGLSDEYHQLFTSGRNGADLGDWTADFLGSLAAALICVMVCQMQGRKPKAELPVLRGGSDADGSSCDAG